MEAVGHKVHVVCPDKKAGDILRTSLHDFEGDQTYTEKLGHNFVINKTFSEAEKELDGYDAVYCAGGRGPEYIRTDKRVQANPPPSVHVESFVGDKIVLQLRAWVPTPDYLPALRDITEKSKIAINKMLEATDEHAQVELAADPHTQTAAERTPDLS